jgi:hypothetical protein
VARRKKSLLSPLRPLTPPLRWLLQPWLTPLLRLLAPSLTLLPALLLQWLVPLRLPLTLLLPSKQPSAHEKAAFGRLFFVST